MTPKEREDQKFLESLLESLHKDQTNASVQEAAAFFEEQNRKHRRKKEQEYINNYLRTQNDT